MSLTYHGAKVDGLKGGSKDEWRIFLPVLNPVSESGVRRRDGHVVSAPKRSIVDIPFCLKVDTRSRQFGNLFSKRRSSSELAKRAGMDAVAPRGWYHSPLTSEDGEEDQDPFQSAGSAEDDAGPLGMTYFKWPIHRTD